MLLGVNKTLLRFTMAPIAEFWRDYRARTSESILEKSHLWPRVAWGPHLAFLAECTLFGVRANQRICQLEAPAVGVWKEFDQRLLTRQYSEVLLLPSTPGLVRLLV